MRLGILRRRLKAVLGDERLKQAVCCFVNQVKHSFERLNVVKVVRVGHLGVFSGICAGWGEVKYLEHARHDAVGGELPAGAIGGPALEHIIYDLHNRRSCGLRREEANVVMERKGRHTWRLRSSAQSILWKKWRSCFVRGREVEVRWIFRLEATERMRASAGSPSWYDTPPSCHHQEREPPPREQESTNTERERLCFSSLRFSTASAVGERHTLPKHTKSADGSSESETQEGDASKDLYCERLGAFEARTLFPRALCARGSTGAMVRNGVRRAGKVFAAEMSSCKGKVRQAWKADHASTPGAEPSEYEALRSLASSTRLKRNKAHASSDSACEPTTSEASYLAHELNTGDASQYRAAGVLPVCVRGGELHCVLVSQSDWKVRKAERDYWRTRLSHESNWAIYDHNLWKHPGDELKPDDLDTSCIATLAVCGGKRKKKDSCALATAIREAEEETANCFNAALSASPASRFERVHFFAPGKFCLYVLELKNREADALVHKNKRTRSTLGALVPRAREAHETCGVVLAPLRRLLEGRINIWRVTPFARHLLSDRPLLFYLAQSRAGRLR